MKRDDMRRIKMKSIMSNPQAPRISRAEIERGIQKGRAARSEAFREMLGSLFSGSGEAKQANRETHPAIVA
ncbi:MAG: hypothetical protein AAFQ44_00160, partial [Pseudomonadota bacterium]